MTPWLKRQLIVLMGCVALNAAAARPTVGYAERVEVARQTPAPAGQRYLDTCDGAPTDILSDRGDTSCVADAPGAFTRRVTLGLSVALFVLLTLVDLGRWSWRRRSASGALEHARG